MATILNTLKYISIQKNSSDQGRNTEMYLHYIYLQTMRKLYVHNDTIHEDNRRSQ